MGGTEVLVERTVPGLHDFLAGQLLPRYIHDGVAACDLGGGSGVFGKRLQSMGVDVVVCDQAVPADPPVRFVHADLNAATLTEVLGAGRYDLVTAIEVIEHLQAPLGFLKSVAALLAPTGVAIVTTLNLDSLPARLRFAVRGRLRMFDEWGDPTHISPIFRHLLVDRYLPLAGLRLVELTTYPTAGFVAGRRLYQVALRPFGRLLGAAGLAGDTMVLVVAADSTGGQNR